MSAEREAVFVASPMSSRGEQVSTMKEKVVVKKANPLKPSPSPETRPRQSKSSKSADHHHTSSKAQKSSPRDHGDYLAPDSWTRDFRGTSPCVLENIGTQSLLVMANYTPIKRSNLSAKSKKVLRNTADLAITSPGLRNLMEVQYRVHVVLVVIVALLSQSDRLSSVQYHCRKSFF